MTQPDLAIGVDPTSDAIGPAVTHLVAHPREVRLVDDERRRVEYQRPDDPTHLCLVLFAGTPEQPTKPLAKRGDSPPAHLRSKDGVREQTEQQSDARASFGNKAADERPWMRVEAARPVTDTGNAVMRQEIRDPLLPLTLGDGGVR